MIDVISLIVSVSTAIFSFARDNKLANETKRKQIAEFFRNISKTLDKVADDLSIDVVPHGACANMYDYALHLPQVVEGYMTIEKSMELSNMLLEAQNIELLIIETRNDKSGIERIRFASWRFEAAATLIELI